MTEQSIFWPTGTTGDGASEYTDTQLFAWLRRTFNGDMYANRGPLKGYNGELEVTAGTGKVTVGTGAAYVYGIPYENDSALDVSIPTPVDNTRVDRIVLRADWTAQTVRIARIAGTEGGGAPSLTQNPGSIYDVPLALVQVTTGGVITVTDERQFCRFATEVGTENIADGAVTSAKIAGGAVSADMLADGACLAEILDDDGAGSGLDADLIDGAHAGTGANQVLKLDSNGKVPVGNLPLYTKELHIPLCYSRNRTEDSYGPMHQGYWTYYASRFPTGATAYIHVVWSATEGSGGRNWARVGLRDLTAGTDIWYSQPSTPVSEHYDISAVTLTDGHNYQMWGRPEQAGQTLSLHEAKLVLVW